MNDDYPNEYGDRQEQGPEPPHAADAERALIGSALTNPEPYLSGIDADKIYPLKATDFYDERHRWIWATILRLWDKPDIADPVTVVHALRGEDDGKKSALVLAGGVEYIAGLPDLAAADGNVPAYAKLVRDTSHSRKLLKALEKAQKSVWKPGDKMPKDIAAFALAELQKIEDEIQGVQSGATPGQIANAHLHILQHAINTQDFSVLDGEPTNLAPLDELVSGGLRAGQLVILGAQTGQGKTALALDISARMLANKRPVVFISLEMDESELVKRLLARTSRVDLLEVIRGRSGFGGRFRGEPMSSRNLSALADATVTIDELPVFIYDKGIDNLDAMISSVRAGIRKAKNEHKTTPGMIVVDYLQLVRPTDAWGRRDTRAVEVGDVSRALKTLARETELPILALAQLNRNAGKRPTNRPELSDLRDSGAIEQDADLVLFLWEEGEPTPDDEFKPVVQRMLGCSKNRSGVSGGARQLDFHRAHMIFEAAGNLKA